MSSKWILYIGGFELPDKNAAAQRVLSNAKAFKSLGYNVFFVGLSQNAVNEVQTYEGFEYINYPYPKSAKDWFYYLTSIKQLSEHLDRMPNFVVAYNYPALALNRLRKWTLRKKISLIADCTEWYESKGSLLFRLIKSFDTFYRMEKVHPKLDGIIAISRYLYTYYSPKIENIIEIPPLVDLSMGKWGHISYKENYKNSIEIIYAGSPGKGNKDRLDVVIEALSQIKKEKSNFTLKIIGVSEGEYNSLFNKEVPVNIKENIVFKGRLSHTDTLTEIKKAHFSLFLRDNNLANRAGFPTKFVESVSAGTPVLTNSTSNLQDFIVHGKTGILLNFDSLESLKKDLENAICQTGEDISLMKGFCYNSQIFDYRKYTIQFAKLINDL
ncbi:MAG: glycosyltransferase [Neisseria sp.]|nr:glycosyltransferase [Neisseria sp.]